MKLTVMEVGSSMCVALPNEVLARLKIGKGDTLYLTEALDSYRLTSHNPDLGRQMSLVRGIIRERQNVVKDKMLLKNCAGDGIISIGAKNDRYPPANQSWPEFVGRA